MITRDEITEISRGIVGQVKEYISGQLTAVTELIEDLQEQIKSIPAGPKGEQGEIGPQGERGITGDVGPVGAAGNDGSQGPQGPTGAPGDKGERGEPGERGLTVIGEKGIDGKDGRDGRDAKDGRDGANGRDAPEIEILSGIDPAKTYSRGTFAKHAGGLVRMGATGWDTIVEGIAGFILEQNERDFSFKATLTSGAESVLSFHVPFLIYRDIHKDGAEYQCGDVVVADNSSWHCQKDGTKSKPGNSPDWRLIARKGMPGKEGERGPEGPRGRDLTKADLK